MSVSAPVESRLIEAAKQGDRAALERLLLVSQPDLKRFARRSCATLEDAEDAVQLALWQLHRKIGTLRVIRAFASWMFRIVERECRRLLRLQTRTQPLDGDALAEIPIEAMPLDLRSDLSAAIGALPPIYREILILRDIQELTAPETASQLNISVEAVKSRLHRARGMLREALMASGYFGAKADSH
ncbi:MAG TPA: RNA polymerase sigma factor [Burkholderiales bacterium]|nr:RNA polymerase sigma factor [Burkholderiales bacterium]